MPDLTISEVAARTGLTASAIRYYERRRLIAPPPRRHGRRCYDPAMVERLKVLAAARRAGLPIRDLAALLSATTSRPDLDAAFAATLARLDARLAALTRLRAVLAALAACGCASPKDCERSPFSSLSA